MDRPTLISLLSLYRHQMQTAATAVTNCSQCLVDSEPVNQSHVDYGISVSRYNHIPIPGTTFHAAYHRIGSLLGLPAGVDPRHRRRRSLTDLESLDAPCNCLPATGMQAAMEEEYRREYREELRDLRGRLRDDIDDAVPDRDADFKSDDPDFVDEDM